MVKMTSLFSSSDALQKLWDQLLGRETEKSARLLKLSQAKSKKVVYKHLLKYGK